MLLIKHNFWTYDSITEASYDGISFKDATKADREQFLILTVITSLRYGCGLYISMKFYCP